MPPHNNRAQRNAQNHNEIAVSDREMLDPLFEEAVAAIDSVKGRAAAEIQADLHYILVIVNGLKSDVAELKELSDSQEKRLKDVEKKCREQAKQLWDLEEDLKWETIRREHVEDKLHGALN